MTPKIFGSDDEKADIQDVQREEMSRGRRPIDTDAIKQKQQDRKNFTWLLRNGTREEFEDFLIARGQPRENEAFVRSMELYDQYQQNQTL